MEHQTLQVKDRTRKQRHGQFDDGTTNMTTATAELYHVLEKCTQALQVGLDARLYRTLLTDRKRQDLHASSGYDVRKYPGLSVSIAK